MNRIENHMVLDHSFLEDKAKECHYCSANLNEDGECMNCKSEDIEVIIPFLEHSRRENLKDKCEEYVRNEFYPECESLIELEDEAEKRLGHFLKNKGFSEVEYIVTFKTNNYGY